MTNEEIITRSIKSRNIEWSFDMLVQVIYLRCMKWGEGTFSSKDLEIIKNKLQK